MTSRFICMPEPVKGESTFGFLLRFANENGYTGLHAFKWPVRSAVRTDDMRFLMISDLADITGHPPGLIRDRLGMSFDSLENKYRYPFEFSCLVRRDAYNFASPRICPCCMQEQPHLRLVWELPLMVACEDHKVLLQDQCPQCGDYLSWKRSHYDRCDCGRLLADWPIEASDSRLLEFQWLIFSYRINRGLAKTRWLTKIPSAFTAMPIDRLSRAVCGFVHYSFLKVDRQGVSREPKTYCVRARDTAAGARALFAFMRADSAYCLQMLHLVDPPKPQAKSARERKKKAPAVLPHSKFRTRALESADKAFVLGETNDEGVPC